MVRLPALASGLLIEVDGDIPDEVTGPMAPGPAAALLPRPRSGQRSVFQASRVQPAQMRRDPVPQGGPPRLAIS
jgi:hypothetical protein